MKTTIYLLKDDAGGIRYIGKTQQPLEHRLKEHISEAKTCRRNNYRLNWLRHVLTRGGNIYATPICVVPGDGCREEIAYIAYFRTEGYHLVNATNGGEGHLGYKASAQTLLKMRKANLGKHLSESTKAKLRAAFIGRKLSPEAREKTKLAHKGRPHSQRTKTLLSRLFKGRELSTETRARMCKAQQLRRMSEKTIPKIQETK